ncbi:MAG: hypothetical protein H6734_22770, partial [Alphaproteobacteria bacterium]|nr:hypothetical protein [Alphaproteobacteria bacterium]
MRSLVPALSLLLPAIATAGVDVYGTGTGIDGALNVNDTRTINAYAAVTAASAAGSSNVTVDSTAGFTVGGLVLVHRTRRNAFTSGNDASPAIDISTADVGAYELARVTAIAGNVVTFDQPLLRGVEANRAQIVTVPEHTSVTVRPAGHIQASPWNGTKGGVVAFLANGVLDVRGEIETDGAGYRGGVFVNQGGTYGCSALDYPNTDAADPNRNVRAGRKGEGLGVDFTADITGRGNRSSGAGGGNCHNAGGGGGGHRGRGGTGGNSWPGSIGTRAVGGFGGRPLLYSLFDHGVFGGGGGAGDGN